MIAALTPIEYGAETRHWLTMAVQSIMEIEGNPTYASLWEVAGN
jgi:hypothetical protein